MTNPWFRMYTEAVDDEKLRLLDFADRWHFVAILCCKGNGILDEDSPLMRRKVAVKLGVSMSELEGIASRLAEVELIDEETLHPLAWNDRQFSSDHDQTRAERLKRFRENKKRMRNGCETDVKRTPEAEADTEADTEADSSLVAEGAKGETVVGSQNRKNNGADAPRPTFPPSPPWLPDHVWQSFVDHRKAKRKPLTPQAAVLALRDLDKARSFGHDPVALIETAIQAGWTGCVFEDRHFQPPAVHGGGRVQRKEAATTGNGRFGAILSGLKNPVIEGEVVHEIH